MVVEFEQQGGSWAAIEAWESHSSGTDGPGDAERTTVTGGIVSSYEYDGCVYCGDTAFFKCGTCDTLSCHDGYSDTAYCQPCSKQVHLSGDIDEIDGSEQSDGITDVDQSTGITKKYSSH